MAKRKRKKQGYSKDIWAKVKSLWELGTYSTRSIADQFGIDEKTIRERAKKEGWQQQFAAHVDARRRAMMLPVVIQQPRAEGPQQPSPEQAEAIDDAARTQIAVILDHRKDIRNTRQLVLKLLGELGAQTAEVETIAEMIEVHFAGGGAPGAAIRAALRRALSLSNRATTAVNLVNALGKAVGLERQAFGLGNLESEPAQDPAKRVEADSADAAGVPLDDERRAVMILDAIERAERAKTQNAPGTDTKQ